MPQYRRHGSLKEDRPIPCRRASPRFIIPLAASTCSLHAYVDSDFAGCARTRRSTAGGVILLAPRGGFACHLGYSGIQKFPIESAQHLDTRCAGVNAYFVMVARPQEFRLLVPNSFGGESMVKDQCDDARMMVQVLVCPRSMFPVRGLP